MIQHKWSNGLVLCLSLSLAGCDKHSSTEPTTIFVGGECLVSTNTIVCTDASRSEPQNRLMVVDWELLDGSTGLSLRVWPTAPSGQVSFTGLASGTYQVDQSVSSRDGSAQERTYGPFTVPPPTN